MPLKSVRVWDRNTVKTNDGGDQIVVVFTITGINYSMVNLFCHLMRPPFLYIHAFAILSSLDALFVLFPASYASPQRHLPYCGRRLSGQVIFKENIFLKFRFKN